MSLRPGSHRSLLSAIILISLSVHIMGGYFAKEYYWQNTIRQGVKLESETPPEELKPQPEQVQIRLRHQSKKSPPPKKWIQTDFSQLKLPNVEVNVPNTPVNLGHAGISGDGLGGNLEYSPSSVTFKGIKGKGEKIFFVFDRSDEIMRNDNGGFYNYDELKKELAENIEDLKPTALFNAMTFTEAGNMLFKNGYMMVANESNKKSLWAWIDRINKTPEDVGTHPSRDFPSKADITNNPLLGNRGYAQTPLRNLAAAMNQKADLIYYVCTGFRKDFVLSTVIPLTDREKKDIERLKGRPTGSSTSRARDTERYNEAVAEYDEKLKEALAEMIAKREKRGLPPMVARSDFARWRETLRFQRPQRPQSIQSYGGGGPKYSYETVSVLNSLKELLQVNYLDNELEKPTINIIFFRGSDERIPTEAKSAARRITSFFDGKTKIVRGLKASK